MKTFHINVPDKIKFILRKLHDAGYEAYVVGGCVRDTLLGEIPHDWDITTSATPEQIQVVFSQYQQILTGMKHGTIMVLISGEMIEITTYRVDGDYTDGRRPDQVSFTTNITEDLARRDFTINACAATETSLVDPFGGSNDLDLCLIRCVGVAKQRFTEDSLRILRGIRFASVLSFQVEEETKQAMFECKNLLKNVSQERITVEFCKALLGQDVKRVFQEFHPIITHIIPEVEPMIEFQQHNPHHIYNVYEHTLNAVEAMEANLVLRAAMFFHDMGKPHAFSQGEDGIGHFYGHPEISTKLAKEILLRMRFSNADIDQITELVKYHDTKISDTTVSVKRMLNKIGADQFLRLLKVKKADAMAKHPQYLSQTLQHLDELERIYHEVINSSTCYTLKDLAINGDDLMRYGIPKGRKIGMILNSLLDLVIQDNIPNQKEILLETIKELNI